MRHNLRRSKLSIFSYKGWVERRLHASVCSNGFPQSIKARIVSVRPMFINIWGAGSVKKSCRADKRRGWKLRRSSTTSKLAVPFFELIGKRSPPEVAPQRDCRRGAPQPHESPRTLPTRALASLRHTPAPRQTRTTRRLRTAHPNSYQASLKPDRSFGSCPSRTTCGPSHPV